MVPTPLGRSPKPQIIRGARSILIEMVPPVGTVKIKKINDLRSQTGVCLSLILLGFFRVLQTIFELFQLGYGDAGQLLLVHVLNVNQQFLLAGVAGNGSGKGRVATSFD